MQFDVLYIKNMGGFMNIEQELLRRYLYLTFNKDIALSFCIWPGDRKKYCKSQIRNLKILREIIIDSKVKDYDALTIINQNIEHFIELSKETQLYLYSDVSDEVVCMFEEFLLGDLLLKETNLYREIELVKKNKTKLDIYTTKVVNLMNRRDKNILKKDLPVFTVWKILDYVRRKYKNNFIVLSALDKYYNLERYFITEEECNYGYFLPSDNIYVSDNYPKTSHLYRDTEDNEYEVEDSYLEVGKNNTEGIFYFSKFANYLVNSSMVEDKKDKFCENMKSYFKTTRF